MYAEGPSDDPYLNAGGRTQGHSGDIRRAVAILWQAWALWMAVLAVLVLL
jgi:cobalamin biosynthesis protein CobD/CbiB